MSTTNIKLKRSSVPGKQPNTSILELGEVALNTYDGKIFIKKDDGVESIVTLQEVTEDNLAVDSSLLDNATANTLAGVLDDLDAAITTSAGGGLTQVTSDSTLTGLGTSGSPLSVVNDGHSHTVSTITNFTSSVNSSIDTRVDKTFVDALNVDADTLDSLNSTQFLRSDAADTKTSGDLGFSDNVKATFGTGNDLQIYHDGSHSYIDDAGTGSLFIRATNLNLQSAGGSDTYLTAAVNGAVGIRYDGNEKLVTTSTGVGVTGEIRINSITNIDASSNTTTSTTEKEITSFAAASYSSGKFIVQATDSVSGEVHITEILIVHDGTTASATEYGTIHTGTSPLATYDVDINAGNVRILATAASSNSTTYKVSETLITT